MKIEEKRKSKFKRWLTSRRREKWAGDSKQTAESQNYSTCHKLSKNFHCQTKMVIVSSQASYFPSYSLLCLICSGASLFLISPAVEGYVLNTAHYYHPADTPGSEMYLTSFCTSILGSQVLYDAADAPEITGKHWRQQNLFFFHLSNFVWRNYRVVCPSLSLFQNV